MTPGTDYARLSPERRKARSKAAVVRVRQERAAARERGLCRCGDPLLRRRDGETGSTCQGCRDAQEVKRRLRTGAAARRFRNKSPTTP